MKHQDRRVFLHPSHVAVYARAFRWRLDAKGRVPVGSTWACQVCSGRAHTGACNPKLLERNERALRRWLEAE